MLTPIEELAQSFHTDKNLMKLPTCVFNSNQVTVHYQNQSSNLQIITANYIFSTLCTVFLLQCSWVSLFVVFGTSSTSNYELLGYKSNFDFKFASFLG